MAKKPSKLSKNGSPDADELYSLVGSALSYWEGSEDVLMGLFRWLCEQTEPIAVASYIKAPRVVRVSMFDLALEIYSHRLTDEEIAQIRAATSQLNKLSAVRNEIAHGHVENVNRTEQIGDVQEVVASGNYLLPSFNEGNWHDRNFRFHHTAETIYDFREEVREHRWAIWEIHLSALSREQEEDQSSGSEFFMQRKMATDIASRRIKPTEWARYLRPMQDWPF